FSALAVVTVLLTAGSPAAAATWTVQNANSPIVTNLRSIWGADANNVWSTGGGASNTALVKWDGASWSSVTTPATLGLYSVWGTSASNVWVGGRKGHLMRWNGSTWTTFTSGLETDGTNGPHFIYGIWGTDANNIWAVSSNGQFGNILKWNGASWSTQYTQEPGLRAIWGSAANNIWAVGEKGNIVRFNGSTWNTVSYSVSPALDENTTLFSIWGADGNNVWVGGGTVPDVTQPTLLKWNGTSWARADITGLPDVSSTNSIRGIAGTSANNVYLVGDQGAFASRWNGSTWTTENTGGSSSLNAIWVSSNGADIWVSGASSLMIKGVAVPVATAPTVATPTHAAVTYNSATLGGNVTSDGGTAITERGVVYSLTSANADPQIGGSGVTKVTGTGTTGVFTVPVSSLAGSSAYSYKAYATNPGGTGYSSVSTFNTPAAPAPEIAVSFNGNNVADDSSTVSAVNGTDFGSTPVNGGQVDRTFTITNSGTAVLTVTSLAVTGDFSVTSTPSNNVGLGGTTTFTIRFDPTIQGTRSGTVSFTTNDGDEASYNFAVQGDGMGPQTFDLAGRPLSNAPFDGGQTYIFGVPEPVDSTLGDVVSSGGAPGTNGSSEIGTFNVLRRGAFLAENGYLAFPGTLQEGSGTPAVTAATSAGLWKTAGGNLFLLARTGTTVPEVTGGQFASLPEVPGLSDAGEVSFLGTLVVGQGSVTADNDTGLWSELGGAGLALVMREDEDIPGRAGVKVGKFASGLYATATIDSTTGEAVFPVTYRGASTKTAILRASVTGSTVAVSVVAEEGVAAPGAGANFGNIAGSFSDPGRMDAQGNYVFAALTSVGSKEGIWYQARGTGAPTKVFYAGETAPNTGGATFARLQRPSIGGNGYVAFRASLNANGDNAAGTRNDGIWAGVASNPAGFTCILRRGDGQSVVSNLPAGSLVGNPWGGWLTNSNRGAWRAWLDVNGDGTSAAPTDVHAIYTNLSGSMQLAVRAGDVAAGTTGAVFKSIDLPVVGGSNQYAFLGTLESGDTVTGNNQGLWKSGPNGGSLLLVLRKGDVMTTTEGGKTISKVDLPGSNQTDRQWEQPVMDATGKMVVNVTFTDGSSSQILVP
ncbi:MAG TPA: choice-of-anchor tandem repeat NxxGxxAF-containing protein, partial [Prosthecobacter sp.]